MNFWVPSSEISCFDVTETMPLVRSVSIGVWLTRGSRHEPVEERTGRA